MAWIWSQGSAGQMYLFGLIKAFFKWLKSVRTDWIIKHSDIGTKKVIPKWATKLLVSVLNENYIYRVSYYYFFYNTDLAYEIMDFGTKRKLYI